MNKPKLKTITITIPENSLIVQVDDVDKSKHFEVARKMCNALEQTVRYAPGGTHIKAEPRTNSANVRRFGKGFFGELA